MGYVSFDSMGFDGFYSLVDQMQIEEKEHQSSARSLSTIMGIKKLVENMDFIASIDSERSRNDAIIQKTSLTAEEGFCTGANYKERCENIKEKAMLLLNTFSDARDQNSLDEYFKIAFAGDPCFNGRIDTLVRYRTVHQEGIPESCLDDTGIFDFSTQELMGIYSLVEDYFESFEDDERSKVSFNSFKEELGKYPDDELAQRCLNSSECSKVFQALLDVLFI